MPPAEQRPVASLQVVSPGYFHTIGVPIVTGRAFTDRDTVAGPPTCIVSDALARRYVSPRSLLGLRLASRPADVPDAKPRLCEIVGVARQVRARADETEEVAQVYVPLAQSPIDDIYIAVAPAAGRQDGLAAAVREAIARVDRAQLVSVHSVVTLEDVARQATSRYRFRAALVATFAALALLLAMVGVFGVLGYAVQQRWREFGIRRALGATTGQVMLLVAAGATRLVVTGAAIGLGAAVIAGRAISTFLFGVAPFDLTTIGTVVATLVLTAAMASAAPAIRAARVDPAVAFRSE
jgi:putative ABC transport system permease protein